MKNQIKRQRRINKLLGNNYTIVGDQFIKTYMIPYLKQKGDINRLNE